MREVSPLLDMFLFFEDGKPVLLPHDLPERMNEQLEKEFEEFCKEEQ